MESEIFQWAVNTGGTSVSVLFGIWKMWNGTGKQIVEIKNTVGEIDKRIVSVETKLEG